MFFILWFVFALKNVAWKQTVTGEKFRITRGRPLKFALKLLIVYWIIVFRFRFEFRFCLGVLLVWGLWSSTSFSFSPCFWVRFCCRGWSFPLGLTWDFFLESTLFLWIRENTTFLVGSLVTVSNFVLCCLFVSLYGLNDLICALSCEGVQNALCFFLSYFSIWLIILGLNSFGSDIISLRNFGQSSKPISRNIWTCVFFKNCTCVWFIKYIVWELFVVPTISWLFRIFLL